MTPWEEIVRPPCGIGVCVAWIDALGVNPRRVDARLYVDAALAAYRRRLVVVVVMLDDLALDARWRQRDVGIPFGWIGAEISG
jgi:hypothetical protein